LCIRIPRIPAVRGCVGSVAYRYRGNVAIVHHFHDAAFFAAARVILCDWPLSFTSNLSRIKRGLAK
jgi:hypothetical protein